MEICGDEKSFPFEFYCPFLPSYMIIFSILSLPSTHHTKTTHTTPISIFIFYRLSILIWKLDNVWIVPWWLPTRVVFSLIRFDFLENFMIIYCCFSLTRQRRFSYLNSFEFSKIINDEGIRRWRNLIYW